MKNQLQNVKKNKETAHTHTHTPSIKPYYLVKYCQSIDCVRI